MPLEAAALVQRKQEDRNSSTLVPAFSEVEAICLLTDLLADLLDQIHFALAFRIGGKG